MPDAPSFRIKIYILQIQGLLRISASFAALRNRPDSNSSKPDMEYLIHQTLP